MHWVYNRIESMGIQHDGSRNGISQYTAIPCENRTTELWGSLFFQTHLSNPFNVPRLRVGIRATCSQREGSSPS